MPHDSQERTEIQWREMERHRDLVVKRLCVALQHTLILVNEVFLLFHIWSVAVCCHIKDRTESGRVYTLVCLCERVISADISS